MRNKVFYIFKKDYFWSVSFNNLLNIKKQSTSCVRKPFLITRNRKSLTWETSTKNIYFFWRDMTFHKFQSYVSKRDITKIRKVSFFSIFVPFTRPYTFTS